MSLNKKMKNILKKILLIDDSNATNFFNTMIINKVTSVDEIITAKDGKQALEYVLSGSMPDILFLDINMPVMDGWGFLDEFKKIDKGGKEPIIVLMLGLEITKEEKRKAIDIFGVKEFNEKMLTKDRVKDIVEKYFCKEVIFV